MARIKELKRRDPDDGLRDLFKDNLPRVHWQKIELGYGGAGTPDHNGCHESSEFWVEYKATDAHACPLESEQVGWILRRRRAGGRVFVITRRRHTGGPKLGPPVDELWVHEGDDAAVLRAEGLQAAPVVLHCEGGPTQWDWTSILDVLLHWEMRS